jgi:hypothetical protein
MNKLTFEEFVAECERLLKTFSGNGQLEYSHYKEKNTRYNCREDHEKVDEIRLVHKYETGGVSGGSCWDSSNPQPYTVSRPDSEFEILDFLLSKLNPRISFLEYKELEKQINQEDKTDYEYYGNRTEYVVLSLPLQVIYDHIKSSWENEPS